MDASAGTVSPVNVPGWRDFPLVERVRQATGGLPVELVGDGVAMTAAEHWQGAARGHDNALCMVVSTGVGGGLVLGGKLHPGPTGNAGHIGHISVDLDGDLCPCGARGCVERIASGPNIARRALEGGWQPGPDGDASAAAVAAAARAGDPVAIASFERAAQALAAGIAATATLVEIDIAVIGGGVAKRGRGALRAAAPRAARLRHALLRAAAHGGPGADGHGRRPGGRSGRRNVGQAGRGGRRGGAERLNADRPSGGSDCRIARRDRPWGPSVQRISVRTITAVGGCRRRARTGGWIIGTKTGAQHPSVLVGNCRSTGGRTAVKPSHVSQRTQPGFVSWL